MATATCKQCKEGHRVEDMFRCHYCKVAYCEKCQKDHFDGDHEQVGTKLSVHQEVEAVLTTERDPQRRQQMFTDDSVSRWVGITMPTPDEAREGTLPSVWCSDRMVKLVQPALGDEGRLGAGAARIQYPSLVSFIGKTGSGKSTLIKSFLRFNTRPEFAGTELAREPIPSSDTGATSSTSSNINLYLDPAMADQSRPIMLADSEGLNGDSPEAFRARVTAEETMCDSRTAPVTNILSPRSIEWAVQEKADRFAVVGGLYPRLLYTFSECVVFVTTDSGQYQMHAISLLDWASSGYEKTRNQRAPPALIIVLNQPRVTLSDPRWRDPEQAADLWLEQLDNNPEFTRFMDLQALWRQRGTEIPTPSRLLEKYYSRIRVVWIPHKNDRPYSEIYDQYTKLHREIREASQSIAQQKHNANLVLDTESFQVYLRKALQHFAKNEKTPFDLEEAAGLVRPVPIRFPEHVLGVLLQLKKNGEYVDSEERLLRDIAPLIAAAVGVSAHQSREHEDLIRHWDIASFATLCEEVYNRFYENHWRCQDFLVVEHARKRCTNVKSGHAKGHQYEHNPDEAFGIWIRDGDFVAPRDHYNQFTKHIMSKLTELPPNFTPAEHRRALSTLGALLESTKSNRTCLSCLARNPHHVLPCGHVLCQLCALRFDVAQGRRDPALLYIESCPFGCIGSESWPWKAMVKPPTAGVRVLTLDGGGIRGVFEIIMLQFLEFNIQQLGLNVPVVEMFDLIVGTSTGGIIALGLGHCGWSLASCYDTFTELASKIFALKFMMRIPGVRGVWKYVTSYIFKTQQVEDGYKEAFSPDEVLFSPRGATRPRVAVTVVTASSRGYRPYLLANYSRPFSTSQDRIIRPDNPKHELKIWEAARATSAAPTFFKAFTHPGTGQVLEDGAMRNDNPISIADSERRAIWPGSTGTSPSERTLDLHLSIGSGVLPCQSETELYHPRNIGLEVRANIARDAVRRNMNAEEQYEAFIAASSYREKYHRINVEISDGGDKTPIDRVADVPRLRSLVREYCKQGEVRARVGDIARRLIASVFYWVVIGWVDGGRECVLEIASRMSVERWESLKAFMDQGRGLKFVLRNAEGSSEILKEVTTVKSGNSEENGYFKMTVKFAVRKGVRIVVKVVLPDEEREVEISGGPRAVR